MAKSSGSEVESEPLGGADGNGLEEEFGGYLELAGAVEGVVGAVDGAEGVDAGTV